MKMLIKMLSPKRVCADPATPRIKGAELEQPLGGLSHRQPGSLIAAQQ
jgi:hypothetical protein